MSKVLLLEDILIPDQIAVQIAENFQTWDMLRAIWLEEKREIQKYIFANDTTKTSNAKLPWSNKTTIPKLCQIRDNLNANYMAALFPRRKWLVWEGDSYADTERTKTKAITAYMGWVMDRVEFKAEMEKLVLDYIDYGNCFATVEWVDSSNLPDVGEPGAPAEQVGYVGPMLRRISPLDIVFNPTAPDFVSSPKIVRSIVSIGEVKEMLERPTADMGTKEDCQKLWEYMKEMRARVSAHPGDVQSKDELFNVAGFDSFRNYLTSSCVEILTFYGDIYDKENDTFQRNQIIKVIDRHKLLSQRTNPSYFGSAPIYHAGWRIRPDNLWAMGPLDNLVGMQYRIDHLENMKADCFDLIAYPPIKIKGVVEDFDWGPMERIYVDQDGDVELLSPDVNVLQADNEIAILEAKMEEMAGSPKEAMGFRTPGEKTMYEVQRLELAAGRIFQNKAMQFEEKGVERWINAMLELAKRNMTTATIRMFDDEFQIDTFQSLTVKDITGSGRIKPIAARHFAEQSNMIQNLTNFANSPLYQKVDPHFSSVALARLTECLLELEDYNVVTPFIVISEQQEAQKMANSALEQAHVEAQTPTGFRPGDADEDEGEALEYNMDPALEGAGAEESTGGGSPQSAPSAGY